MQKRVLNYRPTWTLQVSQPVSGNYYPVNEMIKIVDENTKRQFVVINDRSQGGSSYREGEIELMIHRRILRDDGRGVGEPLNELDYDGQGLRAKIKHYALFEDVDSDLPRLIQYHLDLPLISFIANSKYQEFLKNPSEKELELENDFVGKEFVKNSIKILNENEYLIRVSNINEKNSNDIIFDTSKYNINEVTLTANQIKENLISGNVNIKPLGLKTFIAHTK